MAIVYETPESYKAETPISGEGASGGPAAETEGARWLLRSPEEATEGWLDRVKAKLLSVWDTADLRRAQARRAWARALILAQARIHGDRAAWRDAIETVEAAFGGIGEGNQEEPRGNDQYAARCAATALAFPEVAAHVLGLDAAEVCEALAIPGHMPAFAPGELDLVAQLGFREFWRRRGDPTRARHELLELARSRSQERIPEAVCQVFGPGDAVTQAGNNSDYSKVEAPDLHLTANGWDTIPRVPESSCQVFGPGDAVTQDEYDSETSHNEAEGAGSILLQALRQAERAAATAFAALVRASRAARAEDPEAADAALLGTASLLEEHLADWEVVRLLAQARERLAAAEDRAAQIVGRAESEAREFESLAAAAATRAFTAVAWRELREKVMQIVFNRYRLHLPPIQGDGLDVYREHVRLIRLAQDVLPMLFDAIMARVTGRAGARLHQVIRSDFGAAEWGGIDVDRLAGLAEAVAAAIPEMRLGQEYDGLEDDLRALDYPSAAPGFASVGEILAAAGGSGREEARAAVAAARSGRGRPVVPVAV